MLLGPFGTFGSITVSRSKLGRFVAPVKTNAQPIVTYGSRDVGIDADRNTHILKANLQTIYMIRTQLGEIRTRLWKIFSGKYDPRLTCRFYYEQCKHVIGQARDTRNWEDPLLQLSRITECSNSP